MATKKSIFPYHNGQTNVYADPLKVMRSMIALCNGDLASVVDGMKSPNPEQAIQATERMLDAARKSFAMVPFNGMTGDGACDEEVMTVVNSFFAWLDQKKTTPETLPTSPPVSASLVSVYAEAAI